MISTPATRENGHTPPPLQFIFKYKWPVSILNPHGIHKVRMRRSGLLIAIGLFTGMMLLCSESCCIAATRILKTAYKAYTVKTWQGIDILCEPYQVKKGDWVLKIFKRKGNLSKMDFPLFLTIFKQFNPHIPEPNRIRPGQRLTIPLKKTDPHDFPSGADGKVMVPILQMSKVSGKVKDAFVPQTHLKKGGNLMPEPTKTIVTSSPQPLQEIAKIEHYATMTGGRLLNQGTYYFPGPGQKDVVLDLTTTPVIQLKNNSKLILLPHNFSQTDSLRALESFWQNVSLLDINALDIKPTGVTRAEKKPETETIPIPSVIPEDKHSALKMLAKKAGFDLLPHETTLIMEGGIHIPIKADRIPRDNRPDLLIFLGTVYGNALTLLKHQGYTVLSILPHDQGLEMGRKLFEALGISTLTSPVFMNRRTGQSLSIPGLFVGDGKNIFLSSQPVGRAVARFFTKNRVAIMQFSDNRPPPGLSPKNRVLQDQVPIIEKRRN